MLTKVKHFADGFSVRVLFTNVPTIDDTVCAAVVSQNISIIALFA